MKQKTSFAWLTTFFAFALLSAFFVQSLDGATIPKKTVPRQTLKLGPSGLCLQNAARLWLFNYQTIFPESLVVVPLKGSFAVDVPNGPTLTFRVDSIRGPVSGKMVARVTRSFKSPNPKAWFWTVDREFPVFEYANAVAGGMLEPEDLAKWTFYSSGDPAILEPDAIDKRQGMASAKMVLPATIPSNLQLMYTGIEISTLRDSRLSFWMKADRPTRVGVQILKNTSPFNSYFWATFDATPTWTRFQFTVRPTSTIGNATVGNDTRLRFAFEDQSAGGTVLRLDSLAIVDGNRFAESAQFPPTPTTDSTAKYTFFLEPVISNQYVEKFGTDSVRVVLTYKKATKTRATFGASMADQVPAWLFDWANGLSNQAPTP